MMTKEMPQEAKRQRLGIVALAVLIAVTVAIPILRGMTKAYASPNSENSYRIRAIRAYFYFEETGELGKTDLLSGKEVLRNTTTGAGDKDIPSNTTVVYVDVTGPDFSSKAKVTLELIARAGKRVLLKQRIPLSTFFAHKQSISIPFFVYGTGLEPLKISAALMGTNVGNPSTLTQTIPFSYGE